MSQVHCPIQMVTCFKTLMDFLYSVGWERSGSVVEILTRDRGDASWEGWWKEVSILAWLRRTILSGVFILNLYTYENFYEILT